METSLSETGARRRAMGAFSQAPAGFLAEAWQALDDAPTFETVRGPEIGLVMVRGRTGGGGAAFNLGEASVTRASVRLTTGTVGHAMLLGRDAEAARRAAAFDALWQQADWRETVEKTVVEPIETHLAESDAARTAETEATRVDFFTVARGEDDE